jgi:hypothetical protein
MQVLNHRCFEGDEADDGSTRRILATPQALLGHLLQETHKFHREKKKKLFYHLFASRFYFSVFNF